MKKTDLIFLIIGALAIVTTFFNENLIYIAIFVNLCGLFRNILRSRDDVDKITIYLMLPAILCEVIYFILFNPTYFYFVASRILLLNIFFSVYKLAASYFQHKYRALPFLMSVLYINLSMVFYLISLFGLSFTVFTEDMYIYAFGVPVFISMILIPIFLIFQVLHISIVFNRKIYLTYLISFLSMLIFPFSLIFIPFVSVVLAVQAIMKKRNQIQEECL